MNLSHRFAIFSKQMSHATGHPLTFLAAVLLIVVWLGSGPFFGFSDTWQLVINTGTTIITFLMVFLIQNTQNRDTAVANLKLDELIRAIEGAHNALLDMEELEDEDLERMRADYERLAGEARNELRARGRGDAEARKDRPSMPAGVGLIVEEDVKHKGTSAERSQEK